jgi:short-subunit dehydrogenase
LKRHGAAPRSSVVSRNEDMMREITDRIQRNGGDADYFVADVGDRDAIRRAVDDIVARHGGFDTWVNNAGVGIYASLEETSDEDHERIFRTNYFGVVNGSLEALKHLKRRGGALINVGSISSEMPAPVLSAYTASKHAVKGFTDSLRLELIHEGAPVSVTLIKPSGIHTPFGQHAKNYMDGFSKVPPPVYHPRLVADAILHAAEHPTRDILVGAAGALQVKLAHLMPKLADRIFAAAFYRTAVDYDRAKRQGPKGLHQSAAEGRILGDQPDTPVSVSPYTWAQMHPGATAAMLVGGVAAIGAILASRNGDRRPHRPAHRQRLAAQYG